jgi:hypothetical protein
VPGKQRASWAAAVIIALVLLTVGFAINRRATNTECVAQIRD